MEDNVEIEATSEDSIKGHFSTVTTFSKYLAILLFIALPFIGGWIGWKEGKEREEGGQQHSVPKVLLTYYG